VKILYQILCGKGIYYQKEVSRDGEGGKSGDKEMIRKPNGIK
jgi:hypothetical protein